MCKFYQLEKTNFEFNILDISSEFKESFDYVFEHEKGKLFFVFKTGIKKEIKKIIKSHVKDYYVNQRGYIKCKFLKQ